jgi:hypothetical protein
MKLYSPISTYCHALAAAVAIVFLIGCSNADSKEADHKTHTDHADHSDVSDDLLLPLNAGSQWQLDSHTRNLFQKMVKRFDEVGAPNATTEQLTGLGEALEGDLDELIAGCTMVGDDHNALHKYLMNYMPAVDDLKNSGSLEKAKRVHGLLNSYPKYFE